MRGRAGKRKGIRALAGIGWLALVPVFLVGLYASARTGIAIADRQVPPGSLAGPGGELVAGSRWRLARAGLAVAEDIEALRDFAFVRSGSGTAEAAGVDRLGEASLGWEMQVLAGGDRRYRRVKFLSGDRQGDEVWLIGSDLEALGDPLGELPLQR